MWSQDHHGQVKNSKRPRGLQVIGEEHKSVQKMLGGFLRFQINPSQAVKKRGGARAWASHGGPKGGRLFPLAFVRELSKF